MPPLIEGKLLIKIDNLQPIITIINNPNSQNIISIWAPAFASSNARVSDLRVGGVGRGGVEPVKLNNIVIPKSLKDNIKETPTVQLMNVQGTHSLLRNDLPWESEKVGSAS